MAQAFGIKTDSNIKTGLNAAVQNPQVVSTMRDLKRSIGAFVDRQTEAMKPGESKSATFQFQPSSEPIEMIQRFSKMSDQRFSMFITHMEKKYSYDDFNRSLVEEFSQKAIAIREDGVCLQDKIALAERCSQIRSLLSGGAFSVTVDMVKSEGEVIVCITKEYEDSAPEMTREDLVSTAESVKKLQEDHSSAALEVISSAPDDISAEEQAAVQQICRDTKEAAKILSEINETYALGLDLSGLEENISAIDKAAAPVLADASGDEEAKLESGLMADISQDDMVQEILRQIAEMRSESVKKIIREILDKMKEDAKELERLDKKKHIEKMLVKGELKKRAEKMISEAQVSMSSGNTSLFEEGLDLKKKAQQRQI